MFLPEWLKIDNLNNARTEQTASILSDGKVSATGGKDRDDRSLKSAELYD